jgi:arylsulfatase A-like enzyme
VTYDLARRVAAAERWSEREVVLFGTPAAEPHQVEGFYREAGGGDGDGFLWASQEAELSFQWRAPSPRAAVVDLRPYRGVKGQHVEVRLNGTSVARFGLNDDRHRYPIRLPAEQQRAGDNRLRFVFARAASPADADPKSGDRRRLAAAFYSLVFGAAGDASLEDLLGRDAARPFGVADENGVPWLTQTGPSVVRYAIRLPVAAELRFRPALHAAARRAAASASFRVTLQAVDGGERELWSRVLTARDPQADEVRLTLPGSGGDVVRLGLHVGGASGARFAWGTWIAPRVLGRGESVRFEAGPRPADQERRADALRRGLAGTNVLFVVLDAARARQLGAYGYARGTTPELDRIAGEGIVFEAAFTPAVYTLGAMSSVWTSQHPERHHSEVSFSARLPKDRLTLAELLAARGIHTAGFVANAVAGKAFGFERGFVEFKETYRELGSGAGGFRKVLPAWFDANRGRRFFAYVHFREPHYPYAPPPPFDTRFGPDAPLPASAQSDNFAFFKAVNQGDRAFSEAEREHLVRLYDGNLAYADQELGEIRRVLEATGLWDRTVLIVAADHGESLREHGWIGHNVQVYDESAQVPLVVRFPKGLGPSGLRVSGLADLLDVAPTIADVMGARGQGGPEGTFDGRSLLPMIAGAPGKPAVLIRTVWDRPIYALRDDRYKLVFDTRTGEEKLFDLRADPGETRNVREAQPIRAAYYREGLHDWIASLGRRREAAGPDQRTWTREDCENMKSLGYIGASVPCPEEK